MIVSTWRWVTQDCTTEAFAAEPDAAPLTTSTPSCHLPCHAPPSVADPGRLPIDPLLEHLTQSLGNAYAIERELGGGGMSRVFAAREIAFDRRVVIKVLPPDLAGGVSFDRFRREIQVAARL